jgi:glutamate decarboxylase
MTFLKSPPTKPDAVADEYAATISGSSLPKCRIPEASSDRRAVFDLVRDELFMDGNSRQNLATFCTTYADDEVRRLMDLSIDKNMIDKDEYPQTAEIELRCVHMLADLWHATKSWKTTGCSTTGSSEACMLGCRGPDFSGHRFAVKQLFRKGAFHAEEGAHTGCCAAGAGRSA